MKVKQANTVITNPKLPAAMVLLDIEVFIKSMSETKIMLILKSLSPKAPEKSLLPRNRLLKHPRNEKRGASCTMKIHHYFVSAE